MRLRSRLIAAPILIALVTAVSLEPLRAQNKPAASLSDSTACEWYVTTVAGKKILAQELNVYAEGWLLNKGDDFQSLAAAEILSVMNTGAKPPEDLSPGAVSRLYLSNGDRLVGQLVALSEEGLELKPLVGGSERDTGEPESRKPSSSAENNAPTVLKIPLTSVRALEWMPPGRSPTSEKLLTFEDSARQDILRLKNGDQLSGELTTIALDSLEFLDDQGSRTIQTGEVRALLFNPELLIEPEPVKNDCRIALSDGTLLTLSELTLLDFNRFELKTVLAGTYQVPLERLVSLCTFSENVVPLSRRVPSKVRYTPFLSSIPAWQTDRSVTGAPMQMGGGRYLTGIGVHSRTEITWPLEEGDSRLLADVGIDDSTKGGGSVTFSVLLDGEVAFESGPVRGGELPRLIDIDLKGKQDLTLLVDFGERGDVLDRANWGLAVIVRE